MGGTGVCLHNTANVFSCRAAFDVYVLPVVRIRASGCRQRAVSQTIGVGFIYVANTIAAVFERGDACAIAAPFRAGIGSAGPERAGLVGALGTGIGSAGVLLDDASLAVILERGAVAVGACSLDVIRFANIHVVCF